MYSIVYGKYVWENLNYQVWIFDSTKPVQQEKVEIFTARKMTDAVINIIQQTFPQNRQ